MASLSTEQVSFQTQPSSVHEISEKVEALSRAVEDLKQILLENLVEAPMEMPTETPMETPMETPIDISGVDNIMGISGALNKEDADGGAD